MDKNTWIFLLAMGGVVGLMYSQQHMKELRALGLARDAGAKPPREGGDRPTSRWEDRWRIYNLARDNTVLAFNTLRRERTTPLTASQEIRHTWVNAVDDIEKLK